MAGKKEEAEAEASDNELHNMLDQIVDNAHARLDMAADILRAAVSSIPPEDLAKLLLAATPKQEEPPAEEKPEGGEAEAPAEEAPPAEEAKEA